MPLEMNRMIISWRSFAITLLISLLVGISSAGEVVDRLIDVGAGRMASRPVSGETVVLALDDRTITASPNRDFTMTQYANVVDAANRAGAKRLLIDFYFDRREQDRDFINFVSAVRRMGDRIVLAVPT